MVDIKREGSQVVYTGADNLKKKYGASAVTKVEAYKENDVHCIRVEAGAESVYNGPMSNVTIGGVQLAPENFDELTTDLNGATGGGVAESPDKGKFETLEELQAAYPEPSPGWTAGVGSPAILYDVVAGAWNNTGEEYKTINTDNLVEKEEFLQFQQEVNVRIDALEGQVSETFWACPDMESIPDEDTLTYEQDGETIAFAIGGEARIFDTEKEEYVFYKLYDIADGKATWKISCSGGEQITIKLISNQAQPDTELVGAEITVEIGGVTDVYTWNGTDIKLSLVPSTECRVSVSKIDGYSQPAEQVFTTGISSVRNIEFAYNCCVLTVDFTSNQTDKTDIANATATVNYGTTTKTLHDTDNVLKVPHGETISITYSDVTGYKPPSAVNKVFTAANETQVATWQTEMLNITVSADNSASMNGQIVTVKEGSTVLLNQAWAGSVISLKVPFGTSYVVSCDERVGFTMPELQTYTANTPTRPVTMQYEKITTNYIIIDQTITDPATMISGDVNGYIIQWIRNNSHRYLGKYTADGEMTICQLSDADGTKYAEGTTAVLDGTEGDVWMKLPRFFYHAEEIETDVWKIGFGLEKVDNTWKEWDGNDLIGAYEAYNSSSKAYSRSGVTSTPSVSQENWKTYARARGSGYTLVKHKHQNIMAFLFYAEYGNTNCQALIGAGTSSDTKATGATDALGMEDTQAATNGNSQSINFWGLENWWGNKYELLDNVVVNPVSGNGVWRVTEDDGTTRDVQGVVTGGNTHIKKLVIGENLDVVIKSTDAATDSTGYCDTQYISTSTSRVVARSQSNSNAYGGVACASAYYDSSGAHSSYGSRLAFRGEITEAESVAAYNAIAVTN
jgi:hypothetical protein